MRAADYSVTEHLRDGRRIQIRALRPEDRGALLEAVGRMGAESRYNRFFSPRRSFSEDEITRFTDVDFTSHVALVAVLEEDGRPLVVGGGRYIVGQPGSAEVAFGVDDGHQGLGIGSLLVRHVIVLARQAGLETLHAEVLSRNTAMLKAFERCGLELKRTRVADTVEVSMRLR